MHRPSVAAVWSLVLVASGPVLAAADASPPKGLVRVARLAPGLSGPGVTGTPAEDYVDIAGDPRPVPSSGSWSIATCVLDVDRTASICTTPATTAPSPWVLAQPAYQLRDGRVVKGDVEALVGGAVDHRHRIPVPAGLRAQVATVGAVISPAPELAARDLTSEPVAVPAQAVLGVAFGIEERAWSATAAPVTFAVTALGDGEQVVFEQTLDPGRRADDRRWMQARIPLDALAGRTVRFRFSARSAAADGMLPASLPVWSEPALLAPPAGDLPLGVVLISLDTLRARSTSSGGALRRTTPRLDADVGGNGVIFENANTTAPHTLPAHVSMLTGRYVRSHGVRSPLAHIAPEQTTLVEALQRAGYATAAITENGFVVPEVGLRRGFESYRENKSSDLHRPDGFAAAIFDGGLDWLAQHRDQPFFLFLHTYQVHYPYVPPAPYDLEFEPASLLPTHDDVEMLRYEQEVRYIDDEVALFLDGLAALGLRERTLVVITSDHGEEFLEHGQRYHLFQLYDETVRIPLMMRLPGAIPAGRTVPTAVSLVDVAPTVLDLLGLPPLPDPDGVSLLPLLADDPAPFPRDGVFAETISNLEAPAIDVVALRRQRTACVTRLDAGDTQCFDRVGDPFERHPLPADDARIRDAADAVAAFVRGGASAAGGSPVQGDVDPERLEKLKALGYVE